MLTTDTEDTERAWRRERGQTMRREIILSGAGGQGLILAGAILAEAAGVHEGREVVQTQAYGIQARGGASQSTVIISDERIRYPEVRTPDVLLCLSAEAYARYGPAPRPGGLLIVDRDLVSPGETAPGSRVLALPFTAEAERMGRRIVANMVALGALARASGVVRPESLAEAIRARLGAANAAGALQALAAGVRLAAEATGDDR